LMFHPRRPGFLADVVVDPFPEFAGIRSEIEPFGFLLQIYTLHGACHLDIPRMFVQLSFLTSTCERRSQLYLRLRASGSHSASTCSKPRLMNQCIVRVVSTKILSSPIARARCSMRFRMRSPSPWLCTCGETVSAAISAVFASGYGYSAAQPKITPSCSITV